MIECPSAQASRSRWSSAFAQGASADGHSASLFDKLISDVDFCLLDVILPAKVNPDHRETKASAVQ